MPNYSARRQRRAASVNRLLNSGHVGNRGQTPGPGNLRGHAAGGARREDVGRMLRHIPFQHVSSAGERKTRATCERRCGRGHHGRVAQRGRTRGTPHRRTQRAIRRSLLIASKCLRSSAGLRSYRRHRPSILRCLRSYRRHRPSVLRPHRCREGRHQHYRRKDRQLFWPLSAHRCLLLLLFMRPLQNSARRFFPGLPRRRPLHNCSPPLPLSRRERI